MLTFAIDTSGETCSVAVGELTPDATRIRTAYEFRHERHLTERLPEIVTFVLRDAGTNLHEIDAFAVGRGPGSFTGVRVGVTLAKTLALALDKPVVGVSSLDAIAEPFAALAANTLVAAVPTRRTESIAAAYRPGEAEPIAVPQVVTNTEILPWVRTVAGDFAVLTLLGEAAAALQAAASEAGTPSETLIVQPAASTAAAVIRLAAPRLLSGSFDDTDLLVPLYVAPTPVG